MELRVSQQTMVNTAVFYEQQQTASLAHLQEEASSGNRILAPSDDPLGSVAVINYTAQDANYDTDLSNINTATQGLNVSVSTLQNVHNMLTQASQLAIQGGNATNDPTSLASLGDQVNGLLQPISNRLGQLTQVDNNVLRVVGQQSASLQNLTGLQSQVQSVQLQTKQLSGDISSADMASVVTEMRAQQNLLQATLETTAQMSNMSLLNFIK